MLTNVQNHIGDNDWAFGNMINSNDFTVMQFTGVRNKIGIEIYEGDVISDNVGVGVVIYNEKLAAFKVSYVTPKGIGKWFIDFLGRELECLEVLGNIHENPELLECKK
ncbi:YopX family protein [Vibrio casei]|uniref:YopX family protein n=2 Tax=Vibrio casei TaxID=673372 RepID=UPI003F9DE6E5